MKTTSLYQVFILAIVLITCFSNSADAQLGWTLQQSGTQENIYSMSFTGSSNTGYCAGFNGLLLKTTNGGANWIQILLGTNYMLKCLNFPNAGTGYVIGYIGIVAKTVNSGSNWALYPAGTMNTQISVFFVNGETGFVATAPGEILKTTNGAATWSSNRPVTGNIYSIYFVNALTGYFTGQSNFGAGSYFGIIFKTTDGGSIWDTTHISSMALLLTCIQFTSTETGYSAGSNGVVLKTTDEGISWNSQSTMTNSFLNSLHFLNDNTGYIVGQNGIILKTTNGGSVWTVQQNLATNNNLRSVWFVNTMTGYASGDYGTIIKTTTGGEPIGIKPISYEVPEHYSLYQNYPNPFNPATTINYELPEAGYVKLVIYDILGREIAILVNEKQSAGKYQFTWDASNYTSGVYFYELITDGYSETRKMVLVK